MKTTRRMSRSRIEIASVQNPDAKPPVEINLKRNLGVNNKFKNSQVVGDWINVGKNGTRPTTATRPHNSRPTKLQPQCDQQTTTSHCEHRGNRIRDRQASRAASSGEKHVILKCDLGPAIKVEEHAARICLLTSTFAVGHCSSTACPENSDEAIRDAAAADQVAE